MKKNMVRMVDGKLEIIVPLGKSAVIVMLEDGNGIRFSGLSPGPFLIDPEGVKGWWFE